MALIQTDFKSETLKRSVSFNAVFPIEKFQPPYPTLCQLHGLTDNSNGWLSYSRIRFWAENTSLAIIMPFGKAAILSGALHVYEYPKDWVESEGNILCEVRNFGNLEETRNSDRNPRWLIEHIRNDPRKEFPAFYIACGLQDSLINANRSIAEARKQAGADVTYEEGLGMHDWNFWDTYIQMVLPWLDCHTEEK